MGCRRKSGRRLRTPRRRDWDDDHEALEKFAEASLPSVEGFHGAIVKVPDGMWRDAVPDFNDTTRDHHPGVLRGASGLRMVRAHLGRGISRRAYRKVTIEVRPSRINGLQKPTHFDRIPTDLRWDWIQELLTEPDRIYGTLEATYLAQLHDGGGRRG